MIITHHTIHTFEDIKRGVTNQESEWESALKFCHEWLNGQEYFTLKTSGSTGPPKEIRVHREQLRISAAATKKYLGLRVGCRMLCSMNTEMIAGKMMLVRAMEWQARLFLSTPSAVITSPLPEIELDFGALAPIQLQASLDDPAARKILQNIHTLLIGGAPTPPSLRERARELPSRVFQTFGMTETVSHIAMADLKAAGPLIYKALPGVKTSLSETGTLIIEAPMAIAKKVITLDRVKFVGKNEFEWLGRADFVINSGGVKMFAEVIEAEIEPYWQKFFPQNKFFIWKSDDEKMGEAVLIVMEKVDEHFTNWTDFWITIRQHLPKYHIPRRQLTIPIAFAMTPSGKIDKRKTMKPYLK